MSSTRPAVVVVLAAGEGTRMRSAIPKVLHTIGGRSLLGHALAAARGVEPERLVVVVRHERERVAAHALGIDADVLIADQDDVPGTGRAVQCGLDALVRERGEGAEPLTGTVVVTFGDVPLLRAQTLVDLVAAHETEGNGVTVLSAVLPDPTGYGRIVRDDDGAVASIVEQKDATDAQRAIVEVNTGIWAFDAAVLTAALPKVGRANAQGEVYLTDVLALARTDGHRVAARPVADAGEVEGVNDRVQLAALGAALNRRTLQAHMRAGVTVVDPATTWVDVHVDLGADVTLLPGTQLLGATSVAAGAVVGPDTTLTDCEVGEGAVVTRTHGELAVVGAGASVGPFSFLRPGTRLGERGKIGAFVETKNADIGARSKVPHLSYVGDAEIGEGANIGAATIFANYDGQTKSRTRVGDAAFVGSDSVLVAPVSIGDGAYTAAGSVITDDVPPGAIGVGRGRQKNIEGWTERKRPGSASARAAAAARAATTNGPADARAEQEERA
ncbi:UDP-N-acetylglucosamine pyrophosphorylase /glucosamine-1-phosphate N-acetyltransferase [Quadrisphaera granulorum]|uniref:Bifunctional protein GlmU n=1 Tax=Quadrisphaera granulorum TaxID=317664 RepID=A0A316AEK3_9ACTN|nr:bifunctional UDP-N-acetylglucosamine diphosphorylase/glucosamine-1-phosphate N-acetyltransferase GlmU [Quadrisphaera granulorum]PWJ56051.1 UDP-N-acetylglucosamine pyrophosphorylase /glucosamine-1-phosphate N-acetyltransferase [Quadrisphaera granulorum]SZE94685.1 UDP-N-acetylglucosamine pyrophosphorylase /glucosamine-1-phosphate N-acetyltransferase [Quadrisphaera granulorum]